MATQQELSIAFAKVAGTLDAARKENVLPNDPKLLNLMKGIVGNNPEIRSHISVLWANFDKEVNATIISNI